MVSADTRSCSARISRARSSFVPVSRATIGRLTGRVASALTSPFATSSHRVMPPKMLIRMHRTFGSLVMMSSAATTLSGLELPPMSRKFAGSPP